MKILLIDHHELFRSGLRCMLLKLSGGMDELLEADNCEEGMKCVELHTDLNMVLLEPQSPGCKGTDSVKIFRDRFPHIKLLVVSGDEDFHVINRVLSDGANGFVGKSSPEAILLNALKLVSAGDIYVPLQMLKLPASSKAHQLTRRQRQILGGLSEGLSNKEISRKFELAEGTVKVHVAAVYQALHVRNRSEAVNIAERIGLGAKRSA